MRNFDPIYDTISIYNLPENVSKEHIEEIFEEYGTIKRMILKPDYGAAMAHVQYADERSAKDAVFFTDGYCYNGFNLLVVHKVHGPYHNDSFEYRGPTPRPFGSHFANSSQTWQRLFHSSAHFGPKIPRVSHATKGGSFEVIVEGLPPTGSWQDVKDHFRRASPLSATIDRNGGAIVRFGRKKDAEYAVRKYNETKFISHKGEQSIISARECTSDRYSQNVKENQESLETPEREDENILKNEENSEVTESSKITGDIDDSKNDEPTYANSSSRHQSFAEGDDSIDYDEILGL